MKKSLRNLCIATALLGNISLYSDEPYDSVRILPPTPYYVQDAYILYNLINTNGSVVVVDVESIGGGVARYVAQEAANLPTVKEIYSVSAWGNSGPSPKFQRFLSNVKQEMTEQLITPIRMSAQEGAEGLNITADFISLVGGNQADVIYKDILAWYPHLSDIGILCGNNWYDRSIQQGVVRAAATLDLDLQTNNNVWYFMKGQ